MPSGMLSASNLTFALLLVVAVGLGLQSQRLAARLEGCAEERALLDDDPSPMRQYERQQRLRRRSTGTLRHADYSTTLFVSNASFRASRPSHAVTLVTHVTVDRSSRLAQLCRTWQAPMSVSVFRRPGDAADIAVTVALSDACLLEWADVHAVELNTTATTTKNDRSDMFTHYPFNVQRNAALDGATGEWVFLLDADFFILPSNSSSGIGKRFAASLGAIIGTSTDAAENTLWVVPAVETAALELPMPTTFAELREMTAAQVPKSRRVVAFYGPECATCHHPTNVTRYVERIGSADAKPYAVAYEEGYEPYVVAKRTSLPRYDERFIGRGFSKMSFFYELHARGRKFVVLPPPMPFLVNRGPGDVPSEEGHTVVFMERQRENEMHMINFKASVDALYLRRRHHRRDQTTAARKVVPVASASTGPWNWSAVSASRGDDTACIARWRQEDLTPEATTRLENALSYACQRIDCRPLQPGGFRHIPNDLVSHADWAFDRYLGWAMHALNETAEDACDFGGAARLVACAVECFACQVEPAATAARVRTALQYVCSERVLGNCPLVIEALEQLRIGDDDADGGAPLNNRTLADSASLLFTYHYQIRRCTHFNHDQACAYGGAARRVKCDALNVM